MALPKLGRDPFFSQPAWHPPMAAPKHPAKSQPPKKTPADAQDQKKIDDSVAFIRRKLDDSGWLDTVTTNELKQITARLKTLKPDEINKVVGELSSGDLHKLADEAGSPWLGTGLNGDQKFDLFKTLIPGLDENNLTKLGKAVTDADLGMANKEFVIPAIGLAKPDARAAYANEIMYGDLLDNGDFKVQSELLDPEKGLKNTTARILNGEPGPTQLKELINFLECFNPKERANQLFPDKDSLFTPKALAGLAEQLTMPDAETRFKKEDKQKLFDLMTSAMTGEQIADMQSALAAHDFVRAIDRQAELSRKTGQPQVMNATDELGKVLENYTNPKSLEREANEPSNFSWLPVFASEAQSLAKTIVPLIPEIKANVPKAPVSPNAELFFQSFLKTSGADPDDVVGKKKSEYLAHISSQPVNPALKSKVDDYSLAHALDMVAEQSAASVYDKLRVMDSNKGTAPQTQLFGDLALRQQQIRKTTYFTEKLSTSQNGPAEATWLVNMAGKQINEHARKFDLPRALLAGVLAAEVDFDTDFDVTATKNAGLVNGIMFRIHHVRDALSYLGSDEVKADLKAAKLDNVLAYLNLDTTKKYVESIRNNDLDGYSDFLEDDGPMGMQHASLIILKLAHEMWNAGKKNPETKTPANFGDFLKDMSASQMASVFRAYRTDMKDTGGYKHYDSELGIYTVSSGEDFARAVKDPRAAMGYQAYQSEPYFAYYLNLRRW